jgi:Flp pilus assembly pilin Flp
MKKYIALRYIEFCRDEGGQDLVEYSLLLAFIALTAMALLSSAGRSVKTVWTSVNRQLKSAAS